MIKLFTDIATFVQYMPIDINATDEKVGAYIDVAVNEYVIPIVGQGQYDIIYADWLAGTIAGNNLALLNKIRACVAPLAYYEGIATHGINLGDNGATITMTESQRPAFKWQVKKLEKSLLKHGFIHVEALFLYLKATATGSVFNTWFTSDERTYLLGLMLNTSVEFNQYLNIDGRRTLWAMRNNMLAVQESVIVNNITQTIYAELITALLGTPSATQLTLLKYIKRVIAYKAASKSLREHAVTMNEYGVTVDGLVDVTDTTVTDSLVMEKRIGLQLRQYDAEADLWLKQLRTYLNTTASASVWVAYFDSDLYTDPASTTNRIDNSTGGFFVS